MNIKLSGAISQLTGAGGLRMIEAIIAGERDPHVLLSLCGSRIIKAKDTGQKRQQDCSESRSQKTG